ncbi:hypothetical protein B0H16DRAFT_1844317, partial [Mycena metata]
MSEQHLSPNVCKTLSQYSDGIEKTKNLCKFTLLPSMVISEPSQPRWSVRIKPNNANVELYTRRLQRRGWLLVITSDSRCSSQANDVQYDPRRPAGPISKNRKKPELQEIAQALGLETTGTCEVLAARILPVVQANSEEWAKIPRFSGFYAYKRSKSKSAKTSSDKAAEDLSEAAKPAKASTGAERKMSELKVSTDAPPSFQPLGLQHKPAGHKTGQAKPGRHEGNEYDPIVDDGSLGDEFEFGTDNGAGPQTTLEDELVGDNDTLDELGKQRGVNENVQTVDLVVKLLSFGEPPQEVVVPKVAIESSKSPADGTPIHQAQLTELIPAITENHSPMKVRGGQFMRPGLRDTENDAGFMNVGTVEQHIKKMRIKPLEFGPANRLQVTPTGKGYFTADIYYKADAPAPAGVILPVGPTSLTGAGSDKPLQIAQNRAKMDINANPETMELFLSFLRDTAKVDLQEYPKATVENMEEALLQYTNYMAVLRVFKPWQKKRKGYAVPMSSSEFPGQDFTKRLINRALDVSDLTMNVLVGYFEPQRLRCTPTAAG